MCHYCQYCQVFVKTIFLVVVLGLVHGLVVLPVVLSALPASTRIHIQPSTTTTLMPHQSSLVVLKQQQSTVIDESQLNEKPSSRKTSSKKGGEKPLQMPVLTLGTPHGGTHNGIKESTTSSDDTIDIP